MKIFFHEISRTVDSQNFFPSIFSFLFLPIEYPYHLCVQDGDQDKAWVPHIVCGNCRPTLERWYRRENRRAKFGVPRVWCEPTDHFENCHVCKVVVNGHHRGKKTDVFDYPDLRSPLRHTKHCEEHPVPNYPASVSRDSSNSETGDDIP